jgi:hypothetical protein
VRSGGTIPLRTRYSLVVAADALVDACPSIRYAGCQVGRDEVVGDDVAVRCPNLDLDPPVLGGGKPPGVAGVAALDREVVCVGGDDQAGIGANAGLAVAIEGAADEPGEP